MPEISGGIIAAIAIWGLPKIRGTLFGVPVFWETTILPGVLVYSICGHSSRMESSNIRKNIVTTGHRTNGPSVGSNACTDIPVGFLLLSSDSVKL